MDGFFMSVQKDSRAEERQQTFIYLRTKSSWVLISSGRHQIIIKLTSSSRFFMKLFS